MKELSIFIDESGDFGEYDYHSPYYIISMIMHEQDCDITPELIKLENELSNVGYPNHCVHAGPIIRQEAEFRFEDRDVRKKILKKLIAFLRQIDIKCKTVYIEKKHIVDEVEAAGKLAKELSRQESNACRLPIVSSSRFSMYITTAGIEIRESFFIKFGKIVL